MIATKQVVLDSTYAGPITGTPAIGDNMTTVVAKLAGSGGSSGAPTTAQVNFTVPAYQQILFRQTIVLGSNSAVMGVGSSLIGV